MLRIGFKVSKSVFNFKVNSFKPSLRSINLCSKLNASSDSVVKTGGKASLAYYSLDPNYLVSNKPNPIVIYHSLLSSKEMYQNSVQDLAKQSGRAVYLLDMRNHGESPHSSVEESSLDQLSKDVIDFMDEFSLKKAILIGHGVGSLAMLRTSLLYNDRVEKVVAVDMTPMDLPLMGVKLIDRMLFTISLLPRYISLSNARLIAKQQLSHYFRDKILLNYILMNLRQDSKGVIVCRCNLPVIRQMVMKGIERSVSSEGQFDGPALIVSGKYGSMTANNYSKLKQLFPNSKFDFYQRFRHYLHDKRSKQLVNVLTRFIGKHKFEE